MDGDIGAGGLQLRDGQRQIGIRQHVGGADADDPLFRGRDVPAGGLIQLQDLLRVTLKGKALCRGHHAGALPPQQLCAMIGALQQLHMLCDGGLGIIQLDSGLGIGPSLQNSQKCFQQT